MRQDAGTGVSLSREKGATEGNASGQGRSTTRAVNPGVHLEVASAAEPSERAGVRERCGASREHLSPRWTQASGPPAAPGRGRAGSRGPRRRRAAGGRREAPPRQVSDWIKRPV